MLKHSVVLLLCGTLVSFRSKVVSRFNWFYTADLLFEVVVDCYGSNGEMEGYALQRLLGVCLNEVTCEQAGGV